MNRLVIIGNGFDLAHGLPTSYGHFIDDFWKNFRDKVQTEEYKEFVYSNEMYYQYYSNYGEINNFKDFINSINEYKKNYTGIYYDPHQIKLENNHSDDRIIFQFKNQFFKIINRKNLENWVDIENVYYEILKEKAIPSLGLNKHSYPNDIFELNKEFEQVKNLLEKYLINQVTNRYLFQIDHNDTINHKFIYENLKPISIFNKEENILEQFKKEEDIDEIKELLLKQKKEESIESNIYFLNFNYTNTIQLLYKGLLENEYKNVFINNIHGEIGNSGENKINFGFGDEMDEDYKRIENINDKEYLKNFKSFQYMQNSNYRDLLKYIDSDKFQVIIMGHSCGLSDRTLLNTIFEHNNCRSIKVFYHKKENTTDNYTEIIQNISRHFDNKKQMREKIVEKTISKPLPQIQLPKKQNDPLP